MALDRPRFRPIHLVDLAALLSAEFLICPRPAALALAGFTLFVAVLISIGHRPTWVEWLVILAIAAVVAALFLPPVVPHGGMHRRARPSATTAPPSGKIGAPGGEADPAGGN